MELNRSTYYWRARPAPDNRQLRGRIEGLVQRNSGYGYRRITAQLRREGWVVNHKKVARMMREQGWQCRRVRRGKPNPSASPGRHENLTRGLLCTGINQIWGADITYIRLPEGFVYLAIVLDLYSRRIIGWDLSRSLGTGLVLAAFRQARVRRRPSPGCIHHSDRGCQYASEEYLSVLSKAGFRISMSRPGTPYDNAAVESFMKTLKTEDIEPNDYQTIGELRRGIRAYIEANYNRQRLHSSLGYRSPVEFEAEETSNKQPIAQTNSAICLV